MNKTCIKHKKQPKGKISQSSISMKPPIKRLKLVFYQKNIISRIPTFTIQDGKYFFNHLQCIRQLNNIIPTLLHSKIQSP